MELQTDANDIVTFVPVLEWGVFIVQEKTVGVAFDYCASAEDAEAQKRSRIQLHLDPTAALELARALASHATMLQRRTGSGLTAGL
jgi:hypothetical protein